MLHYPYHYTIHGSSNYLAAAGRYFREFAVKRLLSQIKLYQADYNARYDL